MVYLRNILFIYFNFLKFFIHNISGDFIDSIHEKWWGNYDHLESHHGYIQWLFPLREYGVNRFAQPLQPDEIKSMVSNPGIALFEIGYILK